MAGRPLQGFGARQRLSDSREFEGVLRRGRRAEGKLFRLCALRNDRQEGRLGLVGSRRIGEASARNRAKRLVREAFRRLGLGAGWDLVIVLKAGATSAAQREVDHEYTELLERATRRRTGQRRREDGDSSR